MLSLLLDFLFPSLCLRCGLLGALLCSKCRTTLSYHPHRRWIEDLPVYSALFYEKDSLLEQLLYPFKYEHQSSIAPFLASEMFLTLRLFNPFQNILLVPVPLHKSRLQERGYNQAKELSRWISKKTGYLTFELLERVRDTGVQAHLAHREERVKNIQGAFRAMSRCPPGFHIFLIDDIVTTGATLLACKEALILAGANQVSALTAGDRPLNA